MYIFDNHLCLFDSYWKVCRANIIHTLSSSSINFFILFRNTASHVAAMNGHDEVVDVLQKFVQK